MKRYLVELPTWCLIAIVSLMSTAIWAGYAFLAEMPGDIVGDIWNGWSQDALFPTWTGYARDGSLIENTPGWGNQPRVLEPPTPFGLIAFWWPAVASTGIGLLTIAIAPLPAIGRLLRKRIRVPHARVTLFRMMVVIGTVSAWLWLGRFDSYTRTAGTLIFAFMLHAGFRRSFLAKVTRADGAKTSVLSRTGIAGYSLVLLLALAWVISILVWDSYQVRRF
jgi:hypothetical protein